MNTDLMSAECVGEPTTAAHLATSRRILSRSSSGYSATRILLCWLE